MTMLQILELLRNDKVLIEGRIHIVTNQAPRIPKPEEPKAEERRRIYAN